MAKFNECLKFCFKTLQKLWNSIIHNSFLIHKHTQLYISSHISKEIVKNRKGGDENKEKEANEEGKWDGEKWANGLKSPNQNFMQ